MPKIYEPSNSIYTKFSERYKIECNIDNFDLDELPDANRIRVYKNGKGKENLFYFSRDFNNAIKLDNELELLYRLLYSKYFELKYNNKNQINKYELGKIFSLDFVEAINLDTYLDIAHEFSCGDTSKIEQKLNKDEETIKKMCKILY